MEPRARFPGMLPPYLLLAPHGAVAAVFYYAPASRILQQSVSVGDGSAGAPVVGAAHFVRLLSDPAYLHALAATAAYALAVAAAALSAGLFLATRANRLPRGGAIYATGLLWPIAVAPAVSGVVFAFLIDRAATLGVAPLHDGARAWAILIAAAVWRLTGYAFLFYLVALRRIPPTLAEAAALDGAGPARRFWTIVFPHLAPTTLCLALVCVGSVLFDTFGAIDATTAGGPHGATTTLVYKLYADVRAGGDPGGAAAQSVLLGVILAALVGAQRRVSARKRRP